MLAIVTPLMARTHMYIPQSKDIAFVDSTASLDRFSSPTFIVSTASSAGGIPLGVVITSSESTLVLEQAFQQLQHIMPEWAFHGNGRVKGPAIILTDDSKSERQSLHTIWPEATLLLCLFHYLQSWWTWLWDKKNGIEKKDKLLIMNIVRKMVYSHSENELERYYAKLTDPSEQIPCKYQKVCDRTSNHWKSRHEWALIYRQKLLTRGHNTNNIAEAGIRIIKDLVFERVKAYNLVQMFGFITETMELYFQNRLLEISHRHISRPLIRKYGKQFQAAANIDVCQTDDHHIFHAYEKTIEDESVPIQFIVNTYISACSCHIGQSGAPCAHQVAVAAKQNIEANTLLPICQKEMRRLFAKVALGKHHNQDLGFYATLHEKVHSTHQSSSEADAYMDTRTDSLQVNESDNGNTDKPPLDTSELQDTETDSDIQGDLNGIVTDLTLRLQQGDHNLLKGLQKFIRTYKQLLTGQAPTSSIASALHHFGRNYGKICTLLDTIMTTVSCRKATTYSCRKLGERLYTCCYSIFCILNYRYTMECEEVWTAHSCAVHCSQKTSMGSNQGQ